MSGARRTRSRNETLDETRRVAAFRRQPDDAPAGGFVAFSRSRAPAAIVKLTGVPYVVVVARVAQLPTLCLSTAGE